MTTYSDDSEFSSQLLGNNSRSVWGLIIVKERFPTVQEEGTRKDNQSDIVIGFLYPP